MTIDGGSGPASPIGGYDGFVAAVDATTGAPEHFGHNGIQSIGGHGSDGACAVVVDGGTVLVLCEGGSSNLGVGGIGAGATRGSSDLFVVALDSTDGSRRTTFGNAGLMQVSGTGAETGRDLVVVGAELLLLGTTASTGLTLEGTPTVWATSSAWSTLLLSLTSGAGAQPQALALAAIPAKGINDPPFALQVTPDPSGNPVTITCDPPTVATVSGTTVTITGTGSGRIYATQAAGGGRSAATVSRPLTVHGDANVTNWPPTLRGPIVAVAEDAAGNRYVTGSFQGGMDFDPRPGSIQVRGAAGQTDVFVTRIDADGSYAWTQVIGGSAAEYASSLAVGNGVVYVGGQFTGTDLGIGAAGAVASVSGSIDGFIAALDATTGAAITGFGMGGLQRIGGSLVDDVRGLAFDGALYFTGTFASTNLGIATSGTTTTLGSTDAMVGALSPTSGAALTAFAGTGVQRIGLNGYTRGETLHVATGRVLVAGRFAGTGLGIGALGSAATTGQEDGFVAALDATSGTAITAFSSDGIQTFGGALNDYASAVTVSNGTVYLAGVFSSTDLGIGGAGILATTGNTDALVVALSASDGSARSGFGAAGAQRIGGALNDTGNAIAADAGGVYVAGYFRGTYCGIGGPGNASALGADAFVARLDPIAGTAMTGFSEDGFERIGGGADDGALALRIATDGRLLVAGEMQSWNAGLGDQAPGSWGGLGGFLLSLDRLSGSRPQQLTMAPLRALAEGSAPVAIPVTPDPASGNAVVVTSTSPYVATVSGTTVTPLHAGTTYLVAQQASGNGFAAATAGRLLPVVADDWTTTWPPVVFGTVRAVSCDEGGNRYVAGEFSTHRDFDPRRGSIDPQATYGSSDVFVTRFNADGSYAWTQVIAGSGQELALALATPNHEVVITGTFTSPDLGIDGVGPVAAKGGYDVFVAKLAAATGEPATGFGTSGIVRIGSPGTDQVNDVIVLDTHIYLTGSFQAGGFGIGPAAGVSSMGGTDAFVVGLTLAGGIPLPGFSNDGIQVIGGSGSDTGRALVHAGPGLVVAGSFTSPDLGIGATGSMASGGNNDGFIAMLDVPSGAAVGSFGSAGLQRITGTSDEEIWDVATSGGDLYAIGTFSSTNTGIGTSGGLASVAGPDAFVAALNAGTGAANTAFSGDGLVLIASNSLDYGRRVLVTSSEVIAVGDFSGSDLGIGGLGALASSGQSDVFIARLARADGNAMTSFSGDGLERIGGSGADVAKGAQHLSWSGQLVVAADIASPDAGYGSTGPWNGESSRAGLVLTTSTFTGMAASVAVIATTVTVDGDPHHATVAVNPSGLTLSITYNGSSIPPSAVGNYAVQATITQPGYSGSASGTLTIAKAKLTVTAQDKSRRRGVADPPFTVTYHGFVGGDTAAVITTAPTLTTSAMASSGSGYYLITPGGTIAPGYEVEHLPGTLRIFDSTWSTSRCGARWRVGPPRSCRWMAIRPSTAAGPGRRAGQ